MNLLQSSAGCISCPWAWTPLFLQVSVCACLHGLLWPGEDLESLKPAASCCGKEQREKEIAVAQPQLQPALRRGQAG